MADDKSDPEKYRNVTRKATSETSEAPETIEKKVEKVVTGDVITKKRSLGRKFKDIFVGDDAKGVVFYVATEVLLPAAKNLVVDATTKGIERMMYGESHAPNRRVYGYGNNTHISYNNMNERSYDRGYRAPSGRRVDHSRMETRRSARMSSDYILTSRHEAESVVEGMGNILDSWGIVTVSDLHELIGLPTTPQDNKHGWDSMQGIRVRQTREGYLLDIPPADPIR